eukprot:CAMPEP_0118650522 /NCGR_PEP_ID=MMETSP0785-20121206/10292_1 /TAXON_ID=91992 /ORGANISM="Bolidomonas pacifica, Strain CCMP 1866" /LENGTH=484 /DNA_ID=CAMNT_0006542903 /DNA_START=11 /DNA_END=1462 /DNA_ORIENTATION=+
MWENLTKDLSSFVGQLAEDTSSTLQSIDSKLSEGLVGDSASSTHQFPRPPFDSVPTDPSTPPTPLIVDGDILDVTTPTGLSLEHRIKAVKTALMRYDETFTSPLSPGWDLVEEEDLQEWEKDFDLDGKTKIIEGMLEEDPGCKDAFEEFVPSVVPYSDFWARYFFRLTSITSSNIERHEMIVHRLQSQFDDKLVDGIGRLLGGVGSRLQQVKEKVSAVADTLQSDLSSVAGSDPGSSDFAEALKAKNDEISRMRKEFEVALKAKDMEVEDMTKRIVRLEIEGEKVGGGEERKGDEDVEKRVEMAVKKAIEMKEAEMQSIREDLKQRQEIRLSDAVKSAESTLSAKVKEIEAQLSEERAKTAAALKASKESQLLLQQQQQQQQTPDSNVMEEIEKLKEEVKVWQGRAQKCRDDRTKVVEEKKKSDAKLKLTIETLREEASKLTLKSQKAEKDNEALRKRLTEMEKTEKESVKSGSSGVLVQSVQE